MLVDSIRSTDVPCRTFDHLVPLLYCTFDHPEVSRPRFPIDHQQKLELDRREQKTHRCESIAGKYILVILVAVHKRRPVKKITKTPDVYEQLLSVDTTSKLFLSSFLGPHIFQSRR